MVAPAGVRGLERGCLACLSPQGGIAAAAAAGRRQEEGGEADSL